MKAPPLTHFQLKLCRFVFSLHLIYLFLVVYPSQWSLQIWAHNTGQGSSFSLGLWLWVPLSLAAIFLAFGFYEKYFGFALLGIWLIGFYVFGIRPNPATFLILYTLLFLVLHQRLKFFAHQMFWVLFLITILFDLLSAAHASMDLLPFGMHHEATDLPPKSWMYSRLTVDSVFLVAICIRPLRWGACLGFGLFHFLVQILLGYNEFSTTLMVALFFLFNPAWVTTPSDPHLKPYIFFDGVCVLCNRFIEFLFTEDFAHHFYYAPLQGKTAKEKLPHPRSMDWSSLVLFEEGKIYQRSDAVIRIFSEIGGIWHWVRLLKLIPKSVRDQIYDWVATHRYVWFGTINCCRLPAPEEKKYFRE